MTNCYSGKEDEILNDDSSPSVTWYKSSKRSPQKVTISDCTSMSADSPGSRHSVVTQNSVVNIVIVILNYTVAIRDIQYLNIST